MAKVKARKKMVKKRRDVALSFGSAFSYPFNRAKGLLNIFWVLLPIFGWFALGGYTVRIAQEFVKGKFKELPLFSFGEDMKLGFFMFLKALPFFVLYMLVASAVGKIPVVGGIITFLFAVLALPVLSINFMVKESVASYFEFGIVRSVFDNFGDYLVAFLKSIGLAIVFFIMIIVLVGVPCSLFTKNIFIADFYRRKIK